MIKTIDNSGLPVVGNFLPDSAPAPSKSFARPLDSILNADWKVAIPLQMGN